MTIFTIISPILFITRPPCPHLPILYILHCTYDHLIVVFHISPCKLLCILLNHCGHLYQVIFSHCQTIFFVIPRPYMSIFHHRLSYQCKLHCHLVICISIYDTLSLLSHLLSPPFILLCFSTISVPHLSSAIDSFMYKFNHCYLLLSPFFSHLFFCYFRIIFVCKINFKCINLRLNAYTINSSVVLHDWESHLYQNHATPSSLFKIYK